MRIGAQILVQAPEGKLGEQVVSAAAIAVQSLLESDAALHDLHLVIVDNASNHYRLHEWLGSLPALGLLQVPPGLSFGAARNAGYRELAAHGDFDLFLEFDVDNVFPAVWFAPLAEVLARDATVGLLSPGTVMADKWEINNVPTVNVDYETQHYSDIRWRVDKICSICRAAYGAKTAAVRYPPVLKRPACLAAAGLYDEAFVGGGYEDWDEVFRVRQAGWQVRTSLSSFVFHWGAWQRVISGGWLGRNDSEDELTNRMYLATKWPDWEAARQAYVEEWNQLYALP